MKKTLKLALACTLGAAFVFVGCTKDYSSDISKLDTRVSAIEKENVAARLTALENADAQFTEQLKSIDAAITLTNQKIDKVAAESKDYTDAQINLLKTQIATLATKEELQNAKADLQGKIDEINGKLDLSVMIGGATKTFSTVSELCIYLTNYSMTYSYNMCVALAKAVDEIAGYLDARIDTTNWRIDTVNMELAALRDTVDAKEARLAARIQKVEGRVSAIETAIGGFTEVEYNQYKATMEQTIKDINKEINLIKERLGVAETKIEAIEGRITGITAKAPYGSGNYETIRFHFADYDTTRIDMKFRVTPAENCHLASVANTFLAITVGESRSKSVDKADSARVYAPRVVSNENGIVTVTAFINSKPDQKENEKIWASLAIKAEDEAGDYIVASAPVEVLEGETITINPENLFWFKEGAKAPVAWTGVEGVEGSSEGFAKIDTTAKEYQKIGPKGPKLYTTVWAPDYKSVGAKKEAGLSLAGDLVTDGAYIVKVKTQATPESEIKYFTLAEIEEMFCMEAGTLALAPKGKDVKVCFNPSNTWGVQGGPTVVDADIFKFENAASATYRVNANMGYRNTEKYWAESTADAHVNRHNQVGASALYVRGAQGATIGTVAFAQLKANYRARLAEYTSNPDKKEAIKPGQTVAWDYINYAASSSETAPTNGYFKNLDWHTGDAELSTLSGVPAMKQTIVDDIFTDLTTVPDTVNVYGAIVKVARIASDECNLFVESAPFVNIPYALTAKWSVVDRNDNGVWYNTLDTYVTTNIKERPADVVAPVITLGDITPNYLNKHDTTVVKGVNFIKNVFDKSAAQKYDEAYFLGTTGKKQAQLYQAFAAGFVTTNGTTPVKVIETVADGKPADVTATFKDFFELKTVVSDAAAETSTLRIVTRDGKNIIKYNATYELTFEKTVFNVKFTQVFKFKTDATPKFALVYSDDVLDDKGNVTIEGEITEVPWMHRPGHKDPINAFAYDVENLFFGKYMRINGYDKLQGQTLTVKFAPAKVAAGQGNALPMYRHESIIEDYPIGDDFVSTSVAEGLPKVGRFNSHAYLNWNRGLFTSMSTYGELKGTFCKVTVTLFADEIAVGTKDLLFTIKTPIQVLTTGAVYADRRVSATEYEFVDMLSTLKVYGRDPEHFTPESWQYWFDLWVKTSGSKAAYDTYGWADNYTGEGKDKKVNAPEYGQTMEGYGVKIDWNSLEFCAYQQGETPVWGPDKLLAKTNYELNKDKHIIKFKKDNGTDVIWGARVNLTVDTFYGTFPEGNKTVTVEVYTKQGEIVK